MEGLFEDPVAVLIVLVPPTHRILAVVVPGIFIIFLLRGELGDIVTLAPRLLGIHGGFAIRAPRTLRILGDIVLRVRLFRELVAVAGLRGPEDAARQQCYREAAVLVVRRLKWKDGHARGCLHLLGGHRDQLQEVSWATLVVPIEVADREHKVILGPFGAAMKAVPDNDALNASGFKFGQGLNGVGLR